MVTTRRTLILLEPNSINLWPKIEKKSKNFEIPRKKINLGAHSLSILGTISTVLGHSSSLPTKICSKSAGKSSFLCEKIQWVKPREVPPKRQPQMNCILFTALHFICPIFMGIDNLVSPLLFPSSLSMELALQRGEG